MSDDVLRVWESVESALRDAGRFGVHRDPRGGRIMGWWPAKPGEQTLDDDFRVAWLRHEIFFPITERELRESEELLGRQVPEPLSMFLMNCSNGLRVASGDLNLFGIRRGDDHDPDDLVVEGVEHPVDAAPSHFFFGSWGDDGNLIYLDDLDGTVHVAALDSVKPLRSWASFARFLAEAPLEHLSSFDANGKRIGHVGVEDQTAQSATPPSSTTLPKMDARAEAAVLGFLARASGRTLHIQGADYQIAEASELSGAQHGYQPGGDEAENMEDWGSDWLVIGWDVDLGDPLYIDLADEKLAVLTAEHGAGRWMPRQVADSLSTLLE